MKATRLASVYHSSETPIESLASGASRWGHGGVYATVEPSGRGGSHLYLLEGPFLVADIEETEHGSFHILQGYGRDGEFNALLRKLGPDAGLPTSGPPWTCPRDQFGIDYYRDLHRLLREHFEAEGFCGWWMGGEVVLWDYALLGDMREVFPDDDKRAR